MSIISKGGRVTTEQPRGREQGPASGTIDTIGSAINIAYDELPVTQDSRLTAGYAELVETLIDNQAGGYTDYNNIVGSIFGDDRDEDRIWSDVAKLREHDPVKFGKLPKSREEFEYGLLAREGRREQDKRIVERGGAVAGFTGGAIGYFPDPLNLATLPLGGGKTILQTALRTAGVNAGIEVLQLPSTVAAREALGEDASAGYLATRVGAAAAGGFVLGGAIKGAGVVGGKAYDGALSRLEPIIVERWDSLPAPLRDRLSKSATIADRDLPDLAEAIIGRDNMSIDEKLAVDVMRRDVEIRDASPFKPGMAGDEAHRVRLDDALAKLLQPIDRAPRAFALPSRPDLMGSTSLSTGAPSSSAAGAVKARIARAESGGSDDPNAAKNPRSSATGKYQFVSGTWLRYYKRRFGGQGLSDAEILAKRSDGRIQEILMDDLTADNSAFLRAIGEAETAGNLYLTHFAGQGGARRIFAAEPTASARSVLGDGVVMANPFLDRMTAADVIAWAHRKMDEPAPRRAGARSELADGDGGAVYREQLQREIDRIDAETDAARAARESEDGIGDAIADIGARSTSVADDMVAVDLPAADLPVPSKLELDSAAAGLTDREAALLPALRAEIAEAGAIDVAALSSRLDASADEIRAVAAQIAAVEDAPPVAADLIDADALLAARRGFDRQIAAEREAAPDVAPASVESRARIDDILAVSTADSRDLPIADNGRQFLADLISERTGFFSSADGALVESIGKRIALADGATEARRVHLAEAASYVQEMRVARSADDVRVSAADDVAFDPTSKWERADDPAAVAQSDSVGHDLEARFGEGKDGQLTFLLDEGGEARSWGDIAAELAEDEAELAAVRACL